MRKYYYVRQVGMELEGGWNSPAFDTEEIGSDGSVNVDAEYVGEIASPPMFPDKINAWLTQYWPSAVNATCGLHVHVSLRNVASYSRLVTPGFQPYLVERLAAWGRTKAIIPRHPFWKRLAGDNGFCKLEYNPEEQLYAHTKPSSRYTFVNYCWGLHRTVEVRGLPAFKMLTIGQSAIHAVIDSIEAYLRLTAKGDRHRRRTISGKSYYDPAELAIPLEWDTGESIEHPRVEAIEHAVELDTSPETIAENMEA